jgi:DnaJ family protein C protein 2
MRKGRSAEDVRKLWLKVQRGYETLLDAKMKLRYDSSLPFDDEIPTKEMCNTDEKFYELFDATFRRNSTWSTKFPYLDPVDGIKKCPVLGDASTDMKEVDAFYKFWTNFESWRVFDHFAKHNIEAIKQAGDRYQKRKMEKENTDEVKVHAKQEHKRLIELVETARKLDPRIQGAEQAAIDAKNAVKNAAAKKKAEEKAAV